METILTNSKARHEYHIEETYEAGIVLTGTEVKSLRAGKGQIRDAFARVDNDEVWLYNVHISEYSHGNTANHQPKAPRKLLLHKREIQKLFAIAAIKGKALVPLSFYWKNGKVKVQLAVGRGKGVADNPPPLGQTGVHFADSMLTACTLNSGHPVSPSAEELKTPLRPRSGKWKVVKRLPLRNSVLCLAIILIFFLGLESQTGEPSSIPNPAASSGWISR